MDNFDRQAADLLIKRRELFQPSQFFPEQLTFNSKGIQARDTIAAKLRQGQPVQPTDIENA